jgi:5-methylcytosine-specific restriction endonuclease McrA
MVSPTQTEIRFVADDELMQKLQKIRELDGHVQSNASYLELFHRMADLTLNKLDPMAKKTKLAQTLNPSVSLERTAATVVSSTQPVAASKVDPPEPVSQNTPPAELEPQEALLESHNSRPSAQPKKTNPRYIPAALKREIWSRDQGQCTFQSADGKRCSSRYALEVDHIVPLALDGQTKLSNLRLLCRAHHQHQALIQLGPQKVRPFLRH